MAVAKAEKKDNKKFFKKKEEISQEPRSTTLKVTKNFPKEVKVWKRR